MNRRSDRGRTLLEKAQGDAYMVALGARDPAMPDWIVGFHAQQAIEKWLKAVLHRAGIGYPRTHNLRVLAQRVQDAGIDPPPNARDVGRLSPYGTVTRYDSFLDEEEPPPLDRAWAAGCVERTIAWAGRVIGGPATP